MTGIDYAQQDPRWRDILLGFSNKEKIGLYGCLVASGAMIATALGHNTDVAHFHDRLKQLNLFSGPQMSDISTNDFVSRVYPDIQYIERKDWRNQPADLNYFDVGNDVSTEIIVMFDNHPERGGLQTHFCRVLGLTADRKDVQIVDAWDGKRKTLGKSYGAPADKLIYAAIKYHKDMVQGQISVQPRQYVVRKGDTLWQIAVNNNTTAGALMAANRDRIPSDPRLLPVGANIIIP